MDYGAIYDLVETHCRRIGVDLDAAETELLVYEGLQGLVDELDLPEYTVTNRHLFVTTAGESRYPQPEDFGRLLQPREERRGSQRDWGVWLDDGSSVRALGYEEPRDFTVRMRRSPGRPNLFTVSGGYWVLDPVPDDTPYTGVGTYIARVERPEEGDPVLIQTPTLLVNHVLYSYCRDKGLPQAAALNAERIRGLQVHAAQHAKRRQQFYDQARRDFVNR